MAWALTQAAAHGQTTHSVATSLARGLFVGGGLVTTADGAPKDVKLVELGDG